MEVSGFELCWKVVQPSQTLCNIQDTLAEAVSGVYSGWASIGASPEVYMTAMSIGSHAKLHSHGLT